MATDTGTKEYIEDDLLDEDDEDLMEGVYLIFSSATRDYGVEIRYVTEIVALPNVTQMPDMPPYVKGVINLRGHVIPVIDVRLRFNVEEAPYHDRTCVVIMRLRDVVVGLIVDAVVEVTRIPSENIEPPPRLAGGVESRYVRAMGKIGDSVKILLNPENLLLKDEISNIFEEVEHAEENPPPEAEIKRITPGVPLDDENIVIIEEE